MNLTELSRVIEQVGKDRGIKKEIIVEALEQAVLSTAKKKFGVGAQLEAHYNTDNGEIELFQFKTVVENEDEIGDPDMDIALDEARGLDPEVNIGDELGIKLDSAQFGRIDAQTAKQVIFQKVRDAERDIVFNEFINRKGELISGIARRAERGNIIIDLGKTDAILPRNETIPGENYKPGDRVQAFLSDVIMTPRGPQLFLSRTSPNYVIRLFEQEIPEVRDGVLVIVSAAREPGSRTKIAIKSNDRDLDPVGTCIGVKGVRIQAIVQALNGERVDVVAWNENAALYVKEALKPAEISSIKLDERNKMMEIMVEDDKLSVAIGKRGQNVRLAARLTGWKIDIISKSKLQKRTSDALFNLQHIEGINETMAQAIYQTGFLNVFQVAEANIEQLMKIPGYNSEDDAKNLKERAQSIVEKGGEALMLSKDGTPLESIKKASVANATETNTNTAISQAEQRLREALAAAGMNKESEQTKH